MTLFLRQLSRTGEKETGLQSLKDLGSNPVYKLALKHLWNLSGTRPLASHRVIDSAVPASQGTARTLSKGSGLQKAEHSIP